MIALRTTLAEAPTSNTKTIIKIIETITFFFRVRKENIAETSPIISVILYPEMAII